MKVYNKRGNTNYREKKLIKEIQAELELRAKEDPTLLEKLTPANNFEELQAMRNNLLSHTEFEEIKTTEEQPINNEDNMSTTTETTSSNTSTIDPLNRQEPIIRDYVVDKSSPESTGSIPSSFAEPVDFKDAFNIPEPTEEENEAPGVQNQKVNEPKQTKQRPEPINPSFDDMDSKKQKRKTERFAKAITNLGCDILEKGYVWFVTKDITDTKIAELEMKGVIDASLLLTLDEHTQVTVREFFKSQCEMAPEQAKIDKEKRQDMAEALTEVFMEKGIAPSPTQNALLVAAGIIIPLGIQAFAVTQQNKAILTELKKMQKSVSYSEPSNDSSGYEPEPEDERPLTWNELEGESLTDEMIDEQIDNHEEGE